MVVDIDSNRKGFFKINRNLLRGADLTLIMNHLSVFPVRCEFLYCSNEFEVWGISPLFREVATGEEAPEYEVICDTVLDDVHGELKSYRFNAT